MSIHPLWPHLLVLDFPYGRWLTFAVIFAVLYLIFYLAGSLDAGDGSATPYFFCFVIAYLIPASHYISRHTLEAFSSIKPSLSLPLNDLDETEKSLQGTTISTQIRIFCLGSIAGLTHIYFLLTVEGEFLKTLSSIGIDTGVLLLAILFIWSLLSCVITFLIGNVEVFARLARDNVRIDLLDTSNLHGFSRVAVYSTLLLLGALVAFPLLLIGDNTTWISVVPGFLGVFLPMVYIFLMPILPIKKRVKLAKLKELDLIQLQINQLASTGKSLAEDSEKLSSLLPLLEYKREIRQVAEWPFDSPALLRLLFYLLIPPLTWVGAALIERLVDKLSL
jgi:hypothetical protein